MAKGIYKQPGSDFYWIRYAGPDGKIIRESTKTTNFKEAQVKIENQRKAIRDGKDPEPIKKIPHYTFSQLADQSIKWCEKQRSFDSKKYLIKQLVETFGNMPLCGLSVMLIEQFQSDVLNKGKKPATANRLIAISNTAFTKAINGKWLAKRP